MVLRMFCRARFVYFLLLLGSVSALASAGSAAETDYVRYSAPEFFSYEELLALGEDQEFEPELARKLEVITTTPFVSNEAHYRGAKPLVPEIEHLGRSLRFVFWNIERGVMLDDIILLFTDKEAFLKKVSESRQEATDGQKPEPASEDPSPVKSEKRKGVGLMSYCSLVGSPALMIHYTQANFHRRWSGRPGYNFDSGFSFRDDDFIGQIHEVHP